MPSVYVSEKTKEKLYKFINRSRESSEFGAKKKYPNPDRAISFLLKIGLKYPFSTLENLAKLPLVESSITEEDYENPEIRHKIILEELDKVEKEI